MLITLVDSVDNRPDAAICPDLHVEQDVEFSRGCCVEIGDNAFLSFARIHNEPQGYPEADRRGPLNDPQRFPQL